MSSFATTLIYKDIFPNVTTFQQAILDFTPLDKVSDVDNICYKLLYNEFATSNVAYDTPNAFKRHFMNEYYNAVDQFDLRQKISQVIKDIDVNDLNVISTSINNFAMNDAEKGVNSLDIPIDYIDNQQSSKTRENKLKSYIQAIYSIADRMIYDFIDRFKVHFLSIFAPESYYYEQGELDNV